MDGASNEIYQLRWFFERSADQFPRHTALICDNLSLSYHELEERANQLANYLIQSGVNSTHSIALFLERSAACYISILAVLKTGASYVPIEIEYPDYRVNYILKDMPFHSVITSSSQLYRQSNIHFPSTIVLDELQELIAKQAKTRPMMEPFQADQLCYVIYTSGSTGKPKGVEVSQGNICHYVHTASSIYKMTDKDRVYQGFSLAFDASLEEFWMAFANGAALVACTKKDIRSGVGLIEFLHNNKVTVFTTVPTLLSTLKGQLPNLRLLILGGEVCTANLIQVWSRRGLQIMNTYGPTEATVIATFAVCEANKPITIGKPLPGYEVIILDENLNPVPDGHQGELCIAGQGIARGYVNRPEITANKFIKYPDNQEKRLYRTGDLALLNEEGNLVYLGRIDDQIKLRGFRIELNEIETIITEYSSISQAVVSLQELDSPTLVSYLLLKPNYDFNLQDFKAFLKRRLPHYMIPNLIEVVDSFPLLDSGKVNRKALQKPESKVQTTPYVAPESDLEREICKVWEKELDYQPISVDADFFYDLGGHSLIAAGVVSQLRKVGRNQDLSILDLYSNPTIRQLANKINSSQRQRKTTFKAQKNNTEGIGYYLCAAGQFFGCLLQYALSAWQLMAVILCYSWVLTMDATFSGESLCICIGLFLAMPIASLTFVICAKWLLFGRIKPGVYKLWGWFYFRWWLLQRLERNILSPKHLIGSPLIILYYRLLGAKIGKNCYIGSVNLAMFDLITIGDNSSIGYDSRLLGYVVEDGWLKIGRITIGKECFIGARSVVGNDSIIHDRGKLDDMSMLPMSSTIQESQFFSGSPAKAVIAPYEHLTNQVKTIKKTSALTDITYGVLHYFCLVFAMTIYFLCYFPAILFITHFHEKTHYLLTLFLAVPLGAIVFLGLNYLLIGAAKKLIMNKIRPGIYPLKSLYYLRQWTVVKMVDIDEVYVLADTLYFSYFMRFLGAKLGKRVEMGETPHVIADLVTILDEGFIASSAALAWPNVYLDSIKYAPVQVGKRGFIGNMSLLPLGSKMGEGGLLGCLSITPLNNKAAARNTAWLGSPAVFLPKRQIVTGFSDEEKFTPSKRLFYTRLAIEFARIAMPTTFTLLGLFNLLYIINLLFDKYSLATIFCIVPFAEMGIVISLIAVIVGLKWLILGRVKPATKPIWNVFIWKNDVIEYCYNYFINPHFTRLVLGTPFVSLLLRCFGAKIGKRVFIETADFTEFDLISIGDEACINWEAVIQTHLYEDRIFKMSTVRIENRCNVGIASIVLYDTLMEKNSTLGNFSLLMKGESLPENTSWQGIPAQSMGVNYPGFVS